MCFLLMSRADSVYGDRENPFCELAVVKTLASTPRAEALMYAQMH